MRKTGIPAIIIAFLLTLFLSFSPAWPQGGDIQYLKEVEIGVFNLTNEVRRENRLRPLRRDKALAKIARDHSNDMLKRNFFSHTSPGGKSLQDRVIPAYSRSLSRAGENIWGGHGYDYSDSTLIARIIVDSWMSSPGHRANLLNPDFDYVGVGISVMGKEIRATQNFIQRR